MMLLSRNSKKFATFVYTPSTYSRHSPRCVPNDTMPLSSHRRVGLSLHIKGPPESPSHESRAKSLHIQRDYCYAVFLKAFLIRNKNIKLNCIHTVWRKLNIFSVVIQEVLYLLLDQYFSRHKSSVFLVTAHGFGFKHEEHLPYSLDRLLYYQLISNVKKKEVSD